MSKLSTTTASAERLNAMAAALIREVTELSDAAKAAAAHVSSAVRVLEKHMGTLRTAADRVLASLRAK